MHANVRKMIEPEATPGLLVTGEVIKVSDGVFVVTTEDGARIDARRAASCLLQPAEGDLVALLPVPSRGIDYIVAVLERDADGAIGIAAPGGLHISVPNGRFAVVAEGIDLIGTQMGLRAKSMNLDAHRIDFSFRELAARGKEIVAHSETLKVVGRMASSVFESVMSRVDRNYRVVNELEQMSARQLSYTVAESASVHAKHSLVTADELVKVDGKQILIG